MMNHKMIHWNVIAPAVMRNSKNFNIDEKDSGSSNNYFLTSNAEEWFFIHWTKKLGMMA